MFQCFVRFSSWPRLCAAGLISLMILMTQAMAAAESSSELFEIKIKDHLFYPPEVVIPANTKVKLLIINQDATSEEFESSKLNREKVIMGNSKAVIFIGPLAPGRYPFEGEFNPHTAQGVIIAQ